MEVDNEYIYVDLLDTAGEVCLKVYTKSISRKLSLRTVNRFINSLLLFRSVEYTKVSNRIEPN